MKSFTQVYSFTYIYSCLNRKDLISHLEKSHSKTITVAEKDFDTFADFQSWKVEEEKKKTSSYFVQQRGAHELLTSHQTTLLLLQSIWTLHQ